MLTTETLAHPLIHLPPDPHVDVPVMTTPLDVDKNTQKTIADLPQHIGLDANPEWLAARRHRFTGSMIGALNGMSKYESKASALRRKISNKPIQRLPPLIWGNEHEDDAEQAFLQHVVRHYDNASIDHIGLFVPTKPGYGCLGMSPDGILTREENGKQIKELIEYKCPWSWRSKRHIPTIYPMEQIDHRRVPMPATYYCQIQYGMALFELENICMRACHFVVWEPTRIAHSIIPYDKTFGRWLVESSRRIWIEDYWPTHAAQEKTKEIRIAAQRNLPRVEDHGTSPTKTIPDERETIRTPNQAPHRVESSLPVENTTKHVRTMEREAVSDLGRERRSEREQ